jgi:DnaJ-class molecular chaperone
MTRSMSMTVVCPHCKGAGRVERAAKPAEGERPAVPGTLWPVFCDPCGGGGQREAILNEKGELVAKPWSGK